MVINRQDKYEVLRYLGYKGQELDGNIDQLIEESMKEMKDLIKERYNYQIFSISKDRDNLSLEDGRFGLVGNDIRKHLEGSETCILMAVTLGHEVDTRIRYYEKISMTKALILDACATMEIEKICNRICSEIELSIMKDNKRLTSRYSPGYGDLPLNIQKEFLALLGAEKSIGLTSTFTSILIPRKSVTAIVGVIDIENKIEDSSCINCNKYYTCIFSKGDDKSGS